MPNFHEIPLVAILPLFLLGLLLPYYTNWLSFDILTFLVAANFILLYGSHRLKLRRLFTGLMPIFIVIFASSISVFHYTNLSESESLESRTSSYHILKIDEIVSTDHSKMSVNATLLQTISDDSMQPTEGIKLRTYLPVDSMKKRITTGDVLLANGKIDRISSPKNPNSFDYRAFMLRKGIDYVLYADSNYHLILDIHESSNDFTLDRLQAMFLSTIETQIIDHRNQQVSKAMLLGDKSEMSDELYQIYSNTGAIHVLAVSGLHVGILASLCHFLLGLLGLKPRKYMWIRSSIVIIIIWYYAALTGMSPSVFRASSMFSLFFIGLALNRHTNIYNILAGTAMIILCVDPSFLYSVGFQLSFLAVLSIVFFMPYLSPLMPFHDGYLGKIMTAINVTLSAQILIFPLVVFYFHKVPMMFLISSIIAILGAYLVLISGFLMLFISALGGVFLDIATCFHDSILTVLNFSLTYIDALPGSSLQDVWMSPIELILAYVGLAFLMIYLVSPKKTWLVTLFATFLILITYREFDIKSKQNQKSLVIYHSPKGAIKDILLGPTCYSMISTLDESSREEYISKNHRIANGVKTNIQISMDSVYQDSLVRYSSLFAQIGDEVIHTPDDQNILIDNRIDIYHLTSDFANSWNYKSLQSIEKDQQVVLDASIPAWKLPNIIPYLEGKKVWNIREQGAFIYSLD